MGVQPAVANPMTRKALVFALRLAVAAGIYFVIARGLDRRAVTEALTAGVALAVLVAAALTLMQAGCGTLRWVRIGAPLPHVPGLRVSYFAYVEGMFVNQALPSFVGGDAWRSGRWREWGVRLGDAVAATLADRIYGAFGAVCLGAIAILALWPAENLRLWLVAAMVVVGGGALVCVGLFAGALHATTLAARDVPVLVRRIATRIARFHVTGRDISYCIATAVAGHCLAGLGALVVARNLGIEAGTVVIVAGTALVTLLAMVPISLAGWGVREASYLALLAPLGVPPEKAILLGVAIGLQGLVASLLGGVSMLAGWAARPQTA